MVCSHCGNEGVKKFGKNRNGSQRYRCLACKKTFTEEQPHLLGAMRLPVDAAVKCLQLLLDGMSIRAVERFMKVNRNTLCDLILNVGQRCKLFLADRLQGLPVSDVQVDEVWSFVGCKEKTKLRLDKSEENGDSYAYIGIERHTKLIVSYLLGKRDADDTREFAGELRKATSGRFQLSTDGWKPYRTSMPAEFGSRIDFAQLVKVFKNQPREGKYSPGEIIQITKDAVCGSPRDSQICTSHVERSNLTVRMTCRRWTRLTNAFSKSWKHHEAALALYIAFYDFCRPHMTLKTTPAVAARLTDHRWTIEELLTAAA